MYSFSKGFFSQMNSAAVWYLPDFKSMLKWRIFQIDDNIVRDGTATNLTFRPVICMLLKVCLCEVTLRVLLVGCNPVLPAAWSCHVLLNLPHPQQVFLMWMLDRKTKLLKPDLSNEHMNTSYRASGY